MKLVLVVKPLSLCNTCKAWRMLRIVHISSRDLSNATIEICTFREVFKIFSALLLLLLLLSFLSILCSGKKHNSMAFVVEIFSAKGHSIQDLLHHGLTRQIFFPFQYLGLPPMGFRILIVFCEQLWVHYDVMKK